MGQTENFIDSRIVIQEKLVKLFLAIPTEEDFYNEDLFIIGCIPDPTPEQCKFGCRECDSKFWKDTPEMRNHIKEVKEYWEQKEQQQQKELLNDCLKKTSIFNSYF